MMFMNLWKVLSKKIFITISILCVFKFGLFIFLPFPDFGLIKNYLSHLPINGSEALDKNGMNFFNFLSGGGGEKFTIFSIGIIPYIISSIISQLSKFFYSDYFDGNGNLGHYFSRLLTLFCTLFQSIFFVVNFGGVHIESFFISFINIFTLIGGTFFLIFLSELIGCIGFGSGFSLIIFIGIIADIPNYCSNLIEMYNTSTITDLTILYIVILLFLIISIVVLFEKSVLNLPFFYPNRSNNKSFIGKKKVFIPFKINASGVISTIFASTVVFLIFSLFKYLSNINFKFNILNDIISYISTVLLNTGSLFYNILFFSCITFFCYFYVNNIIFSENFIKNLRKGGGMIVGVRPGNETDVYIRNIVNNLTFLGAVYIFCVCTIPLFFKNISLHSFIFSGTSILIIVSVINDLINKIYNFIININYQKYYD